MRSNGAIISVLANNHPGVLTRMTGLFSRRGFNIESLVACRTEQPGLSRLTVVVTGDEAVVLQMLRQLLKLEDILKVEILREEECSASELILCKIKASAKTRAELLKVAQGYGCRVLDIGDRTVTLEVSGQSGALDRFVEKMEEFGILEMARTGLSALERGDNTIQEGLGEK